jgi:hypothetical protein
MMVSEFVALIGRLLSTDAVAFVVLLPFALVIWLFGKAIQAFVLRGHPLMLIVGGVITFMVLRTSWDSGILPMSLLLVVLLIFIGREAYRRLMDVF